MDWSRQLAVVTGATSGIGKALAEGLADRGAAVAICSRNDIQVRKLASALRQEGSTALGVACDVSEEQQVASLAERVLKEADTPTIVINNAGVGRFAPVAQMCASKHGVLGFSKSLMMEVRQRGIRVVAVCPGSVSTQFFDDPSVPFHPNREKVLAPEDVALVVLDTLELPERATVSELDIRPTNP